MKLITCNIWGGIVYEPLMEFIKKNSKDTDIFCFQEVLFGNQAELTEVYKARGNIFNEINSILPEFSQYQYLSPSDHFQSEKITFPEGQAIFVRKSIKVKDNGGFRGYDDLPNDADRGGKVTGSCQWLDIEMGGKNLTVINLHGLWQRGTSKKDTPERITQSHIINNFLSQKEGEKIICGDFNLLPETESIKLLEEGMKNLVKDYGVTSTRSSFYKKGVSQFADYVLVSEGVNVEDFQVLPDEVSDHLPLMVEFD